MINLNHLSPKTKIVFEKLSNLNFNFLKNFVLVGGSALTLYLNHRISEDLDFFTYRNFFDKKDILIVSNNFEVEIINESNNILELIIDKVKVTFFNANYSFLNRNINFNNIKIAKLEDIAAMKINTLFLRAKFRDYYDLYVIVKERKYDLKTLYNFSQRILKGINYKLFSMALIYVDDIEDENIKHLNPKYNVNKEEISLFFIDKLKDINDKLL